MSTTIVARPAYAVFEDQSPYNQSPAPAQPTPPAATPNSVQQDALVDLKEFRAQGVEKAAVIAATVRRPRPEDALPKGCWLSR